MLLGAASGGSASIRAQWSFQTVYWAAYLQDDVRVTDRLTLNLGIRYDYETPRTERFNRLSFFDYDAPNPVGPEVGLPNVRGGLKFVGVGGNPRGWTHPDRNNIGPRFGFAYKVRSFSVLAAYTNSKLISDTHSQKTWISDEYGAGPQNNNNLRLERSLAPQDVSQRFVVNYIYELPLGKGRRWLNRIGPAADAIVGGWTLTGITTFQTGRPLALSTATNNTNSYGGGSRPNNNGTSARLPASQRSLQRWFDTTVFSQPDPFTFGSTGRTLPDVREDGVTNFDVSVHKNFRLNERFTLQFRGEFFNLMNSPQFARPGQVFGNPQFAVVSAQANSPRQIQLGAKLLY